MVLFLYSCRSGVEKTEIPQELLIQVLVDVHFAEGALLNARLSDRDSLRKLYYAQIFEIHQIRESDFENDMTILKYNPKELEQLYERVLEEIKEKEEEINKESPKQKK